MIIATRLPWVLIAPGEMFDNMLQLMRFSVYLKRILNTDNGYFYIHSFIICLFRKHSPYKNCANYA